MHPYIKQVKKSLNISHKTKAEILRDLEEAFASAAEHGETEQQVMDRLGTPEEFAESIQEQLGLSCTEKSSWKGRTGIAIAAFISIIAFLCRGMGNSCIKAGQEHDRTGGCCHNHSNCRQRHGSVLLAAPDRRCRMHHGNSFFYSLCS